MQEIIDIRYSTNLVSTIVLCITVTSNLKTTYNHHSTRHLPPVSCGDCSCLTGALGDKCFERKRVIGLNVFRCVYFGSV